MVGPPELVHVDMKDTDTPAIISRQLGKGTVVWIPWDLGRIYYRVSLPAHAGLFHDVLDRIHPHRQLVTDAHPLVETTLMRQNGRTLLHLVNLSGHSQTGYYAPLAVSGIQMRVAGAFKAAHTLRSPGAIPLRLEDGYTVFSIPSLLDYEVVVLE
jgi:hypothetical protein